MYREVGEDIPDEMTSIPRWRRTSDATSREAEISHFLAICRFAEVRQQLLRLPCRADSLNNNLQAVGLLFGIFQFFTHWLHGAEHFLRSHQSRSYSRIYEHFMKPEGLLLFSQEPFTGPYPEPDQSSRYYPITLRSILAYFPYFEKTKVGLWDHVAVCVCVSVYSPY
jgi:hypothetical protein